MAPPVERFLEAHPDVAAAWYPLLSSAAGRVLALPGLGRWSDLARRVHAVAEPAGWTTLIATPEVGPGDHYDHLTVLSANLWHDWPRQHGWAERLGDVASLVEAEAADILLLQEVARTTSLQADLWLAHRLDMSLVYARANGAVEAIGFEEGLAVLSRFPITRTHLRQLGRTRNPLARRVALAAELATPLGPVVVVCVHLGLRGRANSVQIRALRSWVGQLRNGGTAIVGGDFNATEGSQEIGLTQQSWTDTFRDRHPQADATTHRSGAPWRAWSRHRRLDYVFVEQPAENRWKVLSADHLDAPGGPHSDHRAVLVRLARG